MKKSLALFIAIPLVIMLSFTGCSSDDTPINPPTGNAPQLGTLTVYPASVIQNTATPVRFQLNVTPGVTVVDAEIKLNKKDAAGNLTQLGILRDDGDTAIGDEIANDGIFCGKVSINEASTGNISYVATATIPYGGQNVTSTSSSTDIAVYASVSLSTIDDNKQKLTQGKNFFLNALGGNLNNLENALTQTAAYLQTQSGVSSAVYSPGTSSIKITYTSGIKGGITVPVKDAQGFTTQGGFVSDSMRSFRGGPKIPLNRQTTGTEARPGFNIGREVTDNALIDPNTIGNRNVFIYTPYRTVFTPDKVPIVKNALNNATCRDFKYTEYANQNASLKVLADITKYGFVFMDTHGVGGDIIFTGEVVDITKPDFVQYYLPLLISGDVGLWERLVISNTGTPQDTATVYTAYSRFFRNLQGTFTNSVIFNSSCEGTMTDNLKDAFFAKGAKVYFGYSKVVYSDFAAAMADTVCRRFARGLKTDDAYYDATDPHNPYSARFEKKSSANMSFPFSLNNGDFEAGILEGWTKDGDGRVLVRLGSVAPTQGSYLGIISTGLGFTTSSGSISQCLKIENNQSSIVFKWNFLSEEFLEYIHSQFQDFFRVRVTKPDGSQVTLFSKNIDQIATQFGADTNQVGQLIRVPEIVFDQGDVYMTGWQTTSLDVTPFRGQTIAIEFECGDIGDSIYDTAVLLDEAKVQ